MNDPGVHPARIPGAVVTLPLDLRILGVHTDLQQGLAEKMAGRAQDIVHAIDKQFFADFPEIWSVLEKAYPESGHAGAWGKAADVHAKYFGKGWGAIDIADSYLLGGDKAAALRWLEKAYGERDPNLPYIACSPQWDAVRSKPGFRDILRRMNLLH
ncbi:MAG: hypothetical protein HXY20_11220 [Acidobacteria bacterium]|nr:hypothetical protein [Acidobacteriota bacterium]